MREIKYKYIFRHTKDKDIQTEVFGLDKIEKYPLYHHQQISDYLDDDGYKCIDKLQYTWLKDKNGVEIYEGDIVERIEGMWNMGVNELKRNVVKFEDGSFMFCKSPSGVEVIGNIYENVELL